MPTAPIFQALVVVIALMVFPTALDAAPGTGVMAKSDLEKWDPPSESWPTLAFPYDQKEAMRSKDCGGVNLIDLVNQWKEKFRIQSWRIGTACGMVGQYKGKNSGLTMWSVHDREAFIWVDADKIKKQSAATVESVVIHEMLHVAMADVLETRTEKDIEQFVRTVSDLLYEAEWERTHAKKAR